MTPTFEQIEVIHKTHAPSEFLFGLVFTHCQIVAEIAQQLIEVNDLKVNKDFVVAACRLHDVGYYLLFDGRGVIKRGKAQIQHAIAGAATLRAEGLPEEYCNACLHHIGLGLSAEDVVSQELPIPEKDYRPTTPEERLVMYADKFHSKEKLSHLVFNSYEWYENFVTEKFGQHNAQKWHDLAQEFGKPNLEILAKKYNQEIR
ncbi:MAG TPA: HD domain-containing protein [Candidatus Saccharibacteria bacterium]|nr:HD domain-containing protein [Candidatus Saccharibacteria bacterium]